MPVLQIEEEELISYHNQKKTVSGLQIDEMKIIIIINDNKKQATQLGLIYNQLIFFNLNLATMNSIIGVLFTTLSNGQNCGKLKTI